MRRPTGLALFAVGVLCCACVAPGPAPVTSTPVVTPTIIEHVDASPAAGWLAAGLAEADKVVYVYKDFADGRNAYTQKAWIGDTTRVIPAMDEAAPGADGSTGIEASLDFFQHSWGGYMFTNGALEAGATEPVANLGDVAPGPDLTGAVALSFFARGETGGENVEFFLGGLGWDALVRVQKFADSTRKISLGTVSLTKEWTRYEIPLNGADLTRVGNGFGWVTNDSSNPLRAGVRFYIDDIRYEFRSARIRPQFLQSYASAPPGTDAAIINNFAYVYDNAAAVIALAHAGQTARAQQIADAIVYASSNDRAYPDGRLRNAYANGDPASFPGWQSASGGGFARLPGFYDTQQMKWFEDYYSVSTSTGNLAWAILALCAVYEAAPDHPEYLDTARRIGSFVLTLTDGKGGFTGGFEGWEPNPTKVGYKSTEHNIDLVAAFARLAKLAGDAAFQTASDQAKQFVLSMYDPALGLFHTGTGADGVTVNNDVLPLDCNTWAILALGDGFADGKNVMAAVDRAMGVGEGYDFNTDRDGVWFEGTAQVALAYKQLGDEARYAKILAFLNRSANRDGSITAADRNGVTTGFTVSGTGIPWTYDQRTHVGATAWLAFAQLGVNPFG